MIVDTEIFLLLEVVPFPLALDQPLAKSWILREACVDGLFECIDRKWRGSLDYCMHIDGIVLIAGYEHGVTTRQINTTRTQIFEKKEDTEHTHSKHHQGTRHSQGTERGERGAENALK